MANSLPLSVSLNHRCASHICIPISKSHVTVAVANLVCTCSSEHIVVAAHERAVAAVIRVGLQVDLASVGELVVVAGTVDAIRGNE